MTWCRTRVNSPTIYSGNLDDYNRRMTSDLQQTAEIQVTKWWQNIRAVFPALPAHIPAVSINKRLRTTAGLAYCEEYRIALSAELFSQYIDHFCNDTIPHELAHIAAWILFKDPGHGKGWKTILAKAKIQTTRCHNMINHIWEAKKLERRI